jgi:hypothetical protein
MFSADGLKPAGESKYQSAGVSEKVTITEVLLLENSGKHSLQFKTVNENGKEGQSKRLSLNTEVSPGKSVAAWTISAKYLQNLILSATGVSIEDSQKVLTAPDVNGLKKNLETALIGKSVRGLFSSREYQEGKFAIELYTSEPVGGTKLVWDPNNKYYNVKLPVADSAGAGLPF